MQIKGQGEFNNSNQVMKPDIIVGFKKSRITFPRYVATYSNVKLPSPCWSFTLLVLYRLLMPYKWNWFKFKILMVSWIRQISVLIFVQLDSGNLFNKYTLPWFTLAVIYAKMYFESSQNVNRI